MLNRESNIRDRLTFCIQERLCTRNLIMSLYLAEVSVNIGKENCCFKSVGTLEIFASELL